MLLLGLAGLVALAQDAGDDGWTPIEGGGADFGSALGAAGLAESAAPAGPSLRSRLAMRPVLALAVAEGQVGPALGGSLTHQWWSLRPGRLAPVGETRLRATALLGALDGHELSLVSTHGAWWGPVGLSLGPAAVHQRLNGEGEVLAPALSLGGEGRLAFRLGPLTPWASAGPGWWVMGERAHFSGALDELRLGLGLAWDGRPVGLRLSAERLLSGAPPVDSLSLGLHLRVL